MLQSGSGSWSWSGYYTLKMLQSNLYLYLDHVKFLYPVKLPIHRSSPSCKICDIQLKFLVSHNWYYRYTFMTPPVCNFPHLYIWESIACINISNFSACHPFYIIYILHKYVFCMRSFCCLIESFQPLYIHINASSKYQYLWEGVLLFYEKKNTGIIK